ncbi:MAG: AAA family ATPase [Sulfurimonas sp.]|nr:AAA family ATPase [Sulfurimonas sp.]MDD5203402.1 AAA family ATPase [Sulfurimonas sp.]
MDLELLQKISAQVLRRDTPIYKRWLYSRIDFNSKLIGIKGPRGSGKSTILLQYAKQSKIPASKILYVSCDHPALSGESLYDIADRFYARGGELFLIDEIHKNKFFSQELKAIYDVFDMHVIFSGSSALQIEHSSGDLSRRAVIHNLGVLSLREFIEMETGIEFETYTLEQIREKHYDIASNIMRKIRPLEQFNNYIKYGCYPFYKESMSDYSQKLLEVINLTIDSDLSGIYNIEPAKVDKLKKILYMLCSTKPYELNVSKLSAAVGASWPTLAKYLERMDAGSLVHIVRGGVGMRAVNKPDKLLLDNPNLFGILCGEGNSGSIRESFFVSQVGLAHQVHFFDKGDFIVDDKFVYEVGGASKSNMQLEGNQDGYIVSDDIEIGFENKIPLWLFGFLY